MNLASDIYPSASSDTVGDDLILCRNTLIYFDRKTVMEVARRLFASLADGGWLIAGPSDPPLWDYAPFRTVITAGGVLYQRTAPSAPALARTRSIPQKALLPDPLPPISQVRQVPGPSLDRPVAAFMPEVPAAAVETFPGSDHNPIVTLTASAMDVDGHTMRIRALANLGNLDEAERVTKEALDRYPMSPELHYLQSIIMIALGRDDDAASSLRRLIYIDRTLASAHFALGALMKRTGNHAGARRAFANAIGLCEERPTNEQVRFADGDTADQLAQSAKAQIAALEDPPMESV